MITGMLGDRENSLYSFAYKFPNLVTIVVGILSQAWRMSAITERNSRTVSNFYSTTFSMIQTVMFLGCGGIMLILRPIIMQFYNTEGFESGYFYVPLLLGATIFQAMDNFLSSIYEAAQKTTHSMTSSAMGAVVNIALNIVLIKTIGISGAAIATLASYIVVFIYRIIDTKKYLYMKVYWAKIVVNLILLAGMEYVDAELEDTACGNGLLDYVPRVRNHAERYQCGHFSDNRRYKLPVMRTGYKADTEQAQSRSARCSEHSASEKLRERSAA